MKYILREFSFSPYDIERDTDKLTEAVNFSRDNLSSVYVKTGLFSKVDVTSELRKIGFVSEEIASLKKEIYKLQDIVKTICPHEKFTGGYWGYDCSVCGKTFKKEEVLGKTLITTELKEVKIK